MSEIDRNILFAVIVLVGYHAILRIISSYCEN